MNRRDFMKQCAMYSGAALLGGCSPIQKAIAGLSGKKKKPNIVYILADDMGYGDLSCLNKNSKIHTPHIDQLAMKGMIFTDMHSGSAVCTPTRYGILTGRYSWRTWLKQGVIGGYGKHLIKKDRMTVASMLKEQGYHSACIGKWHLGMDFALNSKKSDDVDYTKPITNGPTERGFDYSFCIPASLDMAPYVYVENDTITAVPDRIVEGDTGKRLMREGPTGADFKHIEVLPTITKKALSYISERAEDETQSPFFLYFPMPAPHTPILPTKEFQGKSGVNEYGDFMLQIDDVVRQLMERLKKHGMEDNTLVIFTSDNGFAPMADLEELVELGHDPCYVFRGTKADIYEGGHHIPFIARWPGVIKPSTQCDETMCLTDLMATAADITGYNLPDNAGEDSVSMLPNFLGKTNPEKDRGVVHHSVNGSFSIRQGKWKLELCPGSGGWSDPRPGSKKAKSLPPVQLYDLSVDIEETTNVQDKHPDVVKQLTALLQDYVDRGRSTAGADQKNDRDVSIYR